MSRWGNRRGKRNEGTGNSELPQAYLNAPRGIGKVYDESAMRQIPEVEVAQRRLAGEAAQALNLAHPHLIAAGLDHEAARRFSRWRVIDPFPEVPPALLNSADIADYACATGMIYPFDPRDLKSASLRLRVEGEYRYFTGDGVAKHGWLLPASHPQFDARTCITELEIPGNSIVFVTVGSRIRLPDYVAMRFNLKIDHVYKGLLLGTGPLVDPGFDGALHIPLHNLTQESYVLQAGEGLIWAEFTKVSPSRLFIADAPQNSARSGAFVPFAGKGGADRGIMEYIREAAGDNKLPRSSLPGVVAAAKDAAEAANAASSKIERGRLVNIGVLVGIGVTALIPLAIFFFQTRGDINDVLQRNAELQGVIQQLDARIERLESELAPSQADPTSAPPLEESTPADSPQP